MPDLVKITWNCQNLLGFNCNNYSLKSGAFDFYVKTYFTTLCQCKNIPCSGTCKAQILNVTALRFSK